MGDHHLGDLDELVLLAVGALRGEAYANAVGEVLVREVGWRVALPTIHAALYRLEERGYIRSEMGGVTAERGGRRKRLYRLTAGGVAALRAVRDMREQMWGMMGGLRLGGEPS